MAHDGSQKKSSRKTTRHGAPKPSRKPPRFGRAGHFAHLHHLLPLACVELKGERRNDSGAR